MAHGAPTLAILVIAQDESGSITRAVESARAVVDEVVVVDGGSTDDTPALAAAAGARVVTNPWPGYAAQRNVAVGATDADWVFFLDADEVIGDDLRNALRATVAADRPGIDGYEVERVGDFLGRWMAIDRPLRLVRRSSATYEDVLVHERPSVPDDRCGEVPGTLWHYGFRSVTEHIERFNRYTDLDAAERVRTGGRFKATRLVLRPAAKFVHQYVGGRLYRKGVPGFAVGFSWLLYETAKELKVYEQTVARRDHEPPSTDLVPSRRRRG